MVDGGAPARARVIPADAAVQFPITLHSGAFDTVWATVERHAPAHRYVVITDQNVASACGLGDRTDSGAPVLTLTIPPGEHEKTRERWSDLTDRMLDAGCGRDTTIIALGGGVVGDLAGFVAATYMRGIPCVQIPTTVVAMVDAAIGGKTGVDTPTGKNLVGAFHQPAAVIIDPSVLATLPVEQRRAGFAEVLKHGAIADAAYFQIARDFAPRIADTIDARTVDSWTRIIERSVQIKTEVVTEDEREAGRRQVLNFGHTIGHAIETLSGYSILHGEAVAIGMVLEARLGESIRITAPGTAETLALALGMAGLPTIVPAGQSPDALIQLMHGDKKARKGSVAFALPSRIGAMAGEDSGWSFLVEDAAIRDVLLKWSDVD